jgi:hypothetical protein
MTTLSASMSTTTARDGLLRLALRADAVLTAAAGLPFAFAAGPLSSLLGPSSTFLRLVGVALIGYGVLVWLIAAPATISRKAAWGVVEANTLWTVVSVVALLAGWLPLTTAGVVIAVVMALHTSVFADLQFLGLWRTRR